MEYDSQYVIDTAWSHLSHILEKLIKEKRSPVDIEALIEELKNVTYFLEDYAFWPKTTEEEKPTE